MRNAAIATVVVLIALAMPAPAPGYPQGWTSDNLVASGTGSVDISVKGDTVHLVYENNGVYYRRSNDQGVTWTSAVRLDAGTGAGPQVTVGPGDTVFVAYVGEDRSGSVRREALVRRSSNAGRNWDSGYYAYVGSATDTVEAVFVTHGCENVSICWQADVANRDYIYWSPLDGGNLYAERRQVWDASTDYVEKPRIAGDGTSVFVAYMGQDTVYHHWNIYCMRYDGTTTSHDVIADESTHALSDPDVSCQGKGLFNIVWTDGYDGSNKVYRKGWDGSGWIGKMILYESGMEQPVPCTIPHSSANSIICRDATGTKLAIASFGSSCDLVNANPSAWAADREPDDETYVAMRDSNDRIRFKRTDTVAPLGATLVIEGNRADGYTYTQANFRISFVNVIDDWDVTGVDTNEDSFTNGITTILPTYSYDQNGPWAPLPNDAKSSALEDSPWIATVDTTDIDSGIWYLRGILVDTAGNTSEVVSGPVVLDKTPPICSISTDPPHDPNSWRTVPTTITLDASDANLDRIEYKVQPEGGTAGNWIVYDGPFAAPEGPNTIYYRAVDKAGNSSDPGSSLAVWVDTTAPVCSVVYPKTEAYPPVDSTTLILKGNINDGVGEVASGSIWVDGKKVCEVDDPESGVIAAPWNTEGKRLGSHTIEIRATDAAGHSGSSGLKAFQLVRSPAVNWYFAEGNTRKEFEEYICVLDAGEKDAYLTLDLMLEDGRTITRTATVAKRSRATFNIKDMLDGEHDVSIHLRTDGQPVVAERPMYFNYRGKWTGGHTSLGVNELRTRYYFSEGTTRQAGEGGPFEEWLCLQNPGGNVAHVQVTYMLATGRNVHKSYELEPHSRKTVSVNADVGPGQDVSAIVESDEPIAAERPMYFAYQGHIDGGHLVSGARDAARTWYFAEGTTRPGFQEYVTIQNPNETPASCDLTFYLEDFSQKKAHLTIPGRTRATCDVVGVVGSGHDVSTKVTADRPVVAERPMYFNYHEKWTGGHNTLGSTRLGRRFYLAEGTARAGFEEWVTVFSSSTGTVAHVVLIDSDGTCSEPFSYPLGKSRRTTIDINNIAGGERDVAVLVVGDNDLAVERPMYFNYKGIWAGGHTAPGFSSD